MPQAAGHDYVIIPAAGSSRRMGCHKLLLPWPTTENPRGLLIDSVLSAWTTSRVHHVVIVIRSDDEQLDAVCRAWPITILRPPTTPADMKASVQYGVRHLENEYAPGTADRCFVAPADLPGISCDLINQLTRVEHFNSKIVVPYFGKKIGHPALIPWAILGEVFDLEADEGVNQMVARHEKQEVHLPPSQAFFDVDTPEEYEDARRKWT